MKLIFLINIIFIHIFFLCKIQEEKYCCVQLNLHIVTFKAFKILSLYIYIHTYIYYLLCTCVYIFILNTLIVCIIYKLCISLSFYQFKYNLCISLSVYQYNM